MFAKQTTVDSILAGFTKQCEQLRVLAEERSLQASDTRTRAAVLVAEAEADLTESKRATSVASRISALIGSP